MKAQEHDITPAPVARWCTEPVLAWLIAEGRHIPATRELFERLCRKLVDCGIPLARATVNIHTLHPQVFGYDVVWERTAAEVREIGREHGIEDSPDYLTSPLHQVFERQATIRRHLEGDTAGRDFPILHEIAARGVTDYLAMPVVFSDGRTNAVTWATDRAGGFAEPDIAVFEDILPVLAMLFEVQATKRVMATLLDTYLGKDPGSRVRDGVVRLGSGETIHAVLWFCDLRDFTALSDAQPRDRTIATLNRFFGTLTAPVHRHGGEVLKFMGDGLLAIFRVEAEDIEQAACRAADAAAEARAAIAALNESRAAARQPALRYGLALHVGDVMYGNIGAPERLDFTVIGPAVNLAARLDGLSKLLGEPLVVSDAFARACPRPTRSLGRHQLRGVSEPQEVFTLCGDPALT